MVTAAKGRVYAKQRREARKRSEPSKQSQLTPAQKKILLEDVVDTNPNAEPSTSQTKQVPCTQETGEFIPESEVDSEVESPEFTPVHNSQKRSCLLAVGSCSKPSCARRSQMPSFRCYTEHSTLNDAERFSVNLLKLPCYATKRIKHV